MPWSGNSRQSVHNGLNEVTASVLETLAVPWPLQGFFKPPLSGVVLTYNMHFPRARYFPWGWEKSTLPLSTASFPLSHTWRMQPSVAKPS